MVKWGLVVGELGDGWVGGGVGTKGLMLGVTVSMELWVMEPMFKSQHILVPL